MKLQRILIILLAIISIGLGIYSYGLSETNKKLTESKNFRFDWSPSQEILMSYWKNNNKLSDQFIDRNFDNNYERINTYTTFGKIFQTCYDKNEDGIFEKINIFNSIDEKVGTCIDSDEDGAIDQFTLILDNGNELIFLDSDMDGRYEKIHFTKDNKTSEILTEKLFE